VNEKSILQKEEEIPLRISNDPTLQPIPFEERIREFDA